MWRWLRGYTTTPNWMWLTLLILQVALCVTLYLSRSIVIVVVR